MEFGQGRNRDARWPQLHSGTGHWIEHPRRDGHDDPRRNLDMRKGARLANFEVMLPQATTMQWMPPIVNDNFPSDMGRMSG